MRSSRLLYGAYERVLLRQLDGMTRPRHVGVMCDGNRRWAREAGFLDVTHGHRVGARKIAEVLGWCDEAGVEVVTLYLLSTDNLQRSAREVEPLLEIITDVVDELSGPEANWQLRIMGSLDVLPVATATRLKEAAERSVGRPGAQVNIAVGYGGRQEIVDAVRTLLTEHSGDDPASLAEAVTVDAISANLYTSGQPDPDLLIRTSGEQRLSGFLLWQSAHSEFWFTDAYWPEFRRVDFLRALRDYAARHRRYGG
ncbi:MAG: isoprenyl transferase [Mycobacteriaceae bacterium]